MCFVDENVAQDVACSCALIADERKADDVIVLAVGSLTVLADYFVIATASNERQMRAIAEEVRQQMKNQHHPAIGVEGDAASGWVLIDVGDVVVHLFTPEARSLYDLELLWGDAPRTDWQAVEHMKA
jgi:ribosome-associated protein